jgi:hypothetical protein
MDWPGAEVVVGTPDFSGSARHGKLVGWPRSQPTDPAWHPGSLLGQTTVSELARHAGMSEQELLAQLSRVLPDVVDKLPLTVVFLILRRSPAISVADLGAARRFVILMTIITSTGPVRTSRQNPADRTWDIASVVASVTIEVRRTKFVGAAALARGPRPGNGKIIEEEAHVRHFCNRS